MEPGAPIIIDKPVNKEIKTIIGEGCRVEGNFFVPSTTRVDGTVKGDIKSENLVIVGSGGMVEGNITAVEVIVNGTIKGNVNSETIELKNGSAVSGNLRTNSIVTEFGSVFNGKCAMKDQTGNIPEMPESEITPEISDVKVKHSGKQSDKS
jgi:cytoskeletal protein CcmA (bactofilin family)